MPPPRLLFADLVKLLQQVYDYNDISPELWNELDTVSALLTYKVFAANPGTSPSKVMADCKVHFNAYFDRIGAELNR